MAATIPFLLASVVLSPETPPAPRPAGPDLLAAAVAEAEAEGVAARPLWRKLLRFKDSTLPLAGVHSDVVTDRFFFAADGDQDAGAELRATLAAMLAPPTADPDDHAQCRFPARFMFLRSELSALADVTMMNCPDFLAWRGPHAIEGVSVIFASGYMSNPSSYYGHLLLKFNSGDGPLTHELLDTSLNYGATYDDRNPFVYIARGLTGGYQSTFTHLTFYNHTHNYAEAQLRDVWEYELDFSQAQVDLLVAHSWEMLGAKNRYYFLKQNCAYRMAELVNLVVDAPLNPTDKQWVMPIDVFERLAEIEIDGRPLVRGIGRLPSRQNRFREGFEALAPAERDAVRRFVSRGGDDLDAALAGLPLAGQSRAIETLIDYYTFREAAEGAPAEEGDRGDLAEDHPRAVRHRLLLARLQRPASTSARPDRVLPPPHEGQKSTLTQFAAVSHADFGAGFEARFRGAYYDFLSAPGGAMPNSELSLVDVRVLVDDEDVRLRAFEIARITNLNVAASGLPGDGGWAWRLRFGAEDRDLACRGCLAGYVEGAYGKGFGLPGGAAAYLFVNGRATALGDVDDHLEAGPSVGALSGPSARMRFGGEIGYLQGLDGDGDGRPYARLQARFGPGRTWDVRATLDAEIVEGEEVSETKIALSRYW